MSIRPNENMIPYQFILAQDPTHWTLYKPLASLYSDPAMQSHILLKGAWHALDRGEYRVAEEFAEAVHKLEVNTFSSRIIEIELLKRQRQEDRISQKLLEIAQTFEQKQLPAQAVKAYKRLAKLDPKAEYDEKVVSLYKQIGKQQKAVEWSKSLDALSHQRKAQQPSFRQEKIGDLSYLTQKLIVDNVQILSHLAEHVRKDKALEEWLFSLIERSKQNSNEAVAAANAITILNVARVSFSGRDFRGISIPNADLSYAILDSADLSHANLSHVSLRGAYLRNAKLSNSNGTGVRFDQQPYFQVKHPVQFLTLSSDGAFLYVNAEKEIQCFNLQTREEVFRFDVQGCVTQLTGACTVSPDGTKLLVGDEQTKGNKERKSVLRLFDLPSGRELCQLSPSDSLPPYYFRAIFSPDGTMALTSDGGSNVRLWDLSSQKELFCWKDNYTRALAFSPDGKMALWGGGNMGRMLKWVDLSSKKEIASWEAHDQGISSVAFSPDGKRALSGGSDSAGKDNTMRLWDLKSRKEVFRSRGFESYVYSVAFSPDGKRALSGSLDNTARLWDLERGKEISCFRGHDTSSVNTVIFSLDGDTAFSGSSDGKVHMWGLQLKPDLFLDEGHTGTVTHACFSRDGNQAFSAGCDRSIRSWDLQLRQEIHLNQDPGIVRSFRECGIPAVAFSSDRTACLWAAYDKSSRLHFYHFVTKEHLVLFELDKGSMHCVALSPDNRHALIGGYREGNVVWLWDIQQKREVWSLKILEGDGLDRIVFSPNGKKAFIYTYKSARILDLVQGQEVTRYPNEGSLRSITDAVFTQDQCLLSTEDGLQWLRHYSYGDSNKSPWHNGSFMVRRVTVSPDEKYVLTGNQNGTISIWDRKAEKELIRMKGHSGLVYSVAFSADGKKALSGGGDCALKMWELFDQQGRLFPRLVWSSHLPTLCCDGLDMTGIKGLSKEQSVLLQQYGAVDHHAPALEEKKDGW